MLCANVIKIKKNTLPNITFLLHVMIEFVRIRKRGCVRIRKYA